MLTGAEGGTGGGVMKGPGWPVTAISPHPQSQKSKDSESELSNRPPARKMAAR
jgi:hypothetical protein